MWVPFLSIGLAEVLVFAAHGVEAIDQVGVLVVGPHLAVDVGMLRRQHRGLRGRIEPFRRERVGGDLFARGVDLVDAGLVHAGHPQIALGIELERQRALRLVGPHGRDFVIGHFAGRRIQLADELMAEVRVPDDAVAIHDDVMGLRVFARQIVFGDDDVGGAAGQPRERL